ncbi:MAG: DUF202 domain-containing protein [Gemmatimonadota bacterium]
MNLQERLALRRTRLANQRTLLAFVRTFLGFVGLGVALIAIFETPFFAFLGFLAMAAGLFVLGAGVASFARNRSALHAEVEAGWREEGP